MPVFGTPFSGFASEHKLTKEELVRAVRFIVASEYEATQHTLSLLTRLTILSLRQC
jgi:hypothetical protein